MAQNSQANVLLNFTQAGLSGATSAAKFFGGALKGITNDMREITREGQSVSKFLEKGFKVSSVIFFGQKMIQATNALQGYRSMLLLADGSAKEANKDFDFMTRTIKDMGLNFKHGADGFTKLAAAARDTGMAGEPVKDLFKAIGMQLVVTNADALRTQSTFMAFFQMLSKGRIYSEELVQQFAEHMPGGLQTFARALGKTTKQLLEDVQKKRLDLVDSLKKYSAYVKREFGPAFEEALKRPSVAWNRFQTQLTLTAGLLGQAISPAFSAIVNDISNQFEKLAPLIGEISTKGEEAVPALKGLYEVFKGFGSGFILGGLQEAATGLGLIVDSIKEASKGSESVFKLSDIGKLPASYKPPTETILPSYSSYMNEVQQEVNIAIKVDNTEFKDAMAEHRKAYEEVARFWQIDFPVILTGATAFWGQFWNYFKNIVIAFSASVVAIFGSMWDNIKISALQFKVWWKELFASLIEEYPKLTALWNRNLDFMEGLLGVGDSLKVDVSGAGLDKATAELLAAQEAAKAFSDNIGTTIGDAWNQLGVSNEKVIAAMEIAREKFTKIYESGHKASAGIESVGASADNTSENIRELTRELTKANQILNDARFRIDSYVKGLRDEVEMQGLTTREREIRREQLRAEAEQTDALRRAQDAFIKGKTAEAQAYTTVASMWSTQATAMGAAQKGLKDVSSETKKTSKEIKDLSKSAEGSAKGMEVFTGSLDEYVGIVKTQLDLGDQQAAVLKRYMPLIDELSQRYGILKEVILSVIKTESNFNPKAKSPKDAQGLMQITPDTAETLSNFKDIHFSAKQILTDPVANLTAGVAYLRDILNKNANDIESALRGYNAGPGNIQKSLKFDETNNYVKTIFDWLTKLNPLVGQTITNMQALGTTGMDLAAIRYDNQAAIDFYHAQLDIASAISETITALDNEAKLLTYTDSQREAAAAGMRVEENIRQAIIASTHAQIDGNMELAASYQMIAAEWAESKNTIVHITEVNEGLKKQKEFADGLGNAIADALGEFLKGGMSAKEMLARMLEGIRDLIIQMLIMKPIAEALSATFNSWMGSSGLGNILFGAGAGVAGGAAASAFTGTGAAAAPALTQMGDYLVGWWAKGGTVQASIPQGVYTKPTMFSGKNIKPYAKGGVIQSFASGGVKSFANGGVKSFANGGVIHSFANGDVIRGFADGDIIAQAIKQGIYSKPVYFPMKDGEPGGFGDGNYGVFAEAGPEAIMPLTRIGGKLGVQATGVGGGGVTVNVYPQPGESAEVNRRNNGDIDIRIIKEAIADDIFRGGTSISNSMELAYSGLRRGR